MHLPHQRALPMEAKTKAAKLLEMKAHKKMIQHQLSRETGKIVLLKDLSNIAACQKCGTTQNDLDATIEMLMSKYGKVTRLLP